MKAVTYLRVLVASGCLLLHATARGEGILTVGQGSVLTGSGMVDGFAQASAGAIVAPGNGIGSLTISHLAVQGGTSLDYELTSASYDLLATTSADQLTITGGSVHLYQPGTTTTFNAPGTYHLMSYMGTLQGDVGKLLVLNPTVARQYSFVNNTASHTVDLIIGTGSTPNHWLRNISTRGVVQTGNNVIIGGFIVTGSNPKRVIVRALGPTLAQPPFNVPGTLANPVVYLYNSSNVLVDSNDDWVSASNAQAISASGFAPPKSKESAILRTLNPGNYTAIVRGAGNTSGVALMEVYDLDDNGATKFTNISTRGFVQTGNNVMISGVIVHGSGMQTLLVRALGPTLGAAPFNVPNALQDPFLDLRDANGNIIATNDNWKSTQQADITATNLAPPRDAESAILVSLPPANYTAIVTGVNNSSGNALVEAYAVN